MIEIPKLSISGDIHDKKGNFRALVFVHDLLNQNPRLIFKTPRTEKGGDVIWKYERTTGIYEPYGVGFVEQAVQKYSSEDCKTEDLRAAAKHLKVATYIDKKDFEEDPGSIMLLNGELDHVTRQLRPANPDHNHKNLLPVKFDPAATCPSFLDFLNKVIPEAVDLIQEIFGYCLIKTYKYQKAFIFQGTGDNGKSTVINVLVAFLGPENVSHETLFNLSSQRFSVANLYTKFANSAADIAPDEIQRTGTFKGLTGWDWMRAEFKNQNPFDFRNYAKLIFSCNQLPATPDKSYAFFKRFCVIKFLRTFIKGVDMDENILDKLTTPEELSGIFNWALVGLHRLQENGDFSKTISVVKMEELWEKMSDPITAYIDDCIDFTNDEKDHVIKADVYHFYNAYCKLNGFTALTDRRFHSAFKGKIHVGDSQVREGDKSPTVYTRIKMKCFACKKCPHVDAETVNGVKATSYLAQQKTLL